MTDKVPTRIGESATGSTWLSTKIDDLFDDEVWDDVELVECV